MVPDTATPAEAWKMIKPEGATFVRGSFWHELQATLPLAKSPARQMQIAEYILRWKRRKRQAWPPIALKNSPALPPQPQR